MALAMLEQMAASMTACIKAVRPGLGGGCAGATGGPASGGVDGICDRAGIPAPGVDSPMSRRLEALSLRLASLTLSAATYGVTSRPQEWNLFVVVDAVIPLPLRSDVLTLSKPRGWWWRRGAYPGLSCCHCYCLVLGKPGLSVGYLAATADATSAAWVPEIQDGGPLCGRHMVVGNGAASCRGSLATHADMGEPLGCPGLCGESPELSATDMQRPERPLTLPTVAGRSLQPERPFTLPTACACAGSDKKIGPTSAEAGVATGSSVHFPHAEISKIGLTGAALRVQLPLAQREAVAAEVPDRPRQERQQALLTRAHCRCLSQERVSKLALCQRGRAVRESRGGAEAGKPLKGATSALSAMNPLFSCLPPPHNGSL